MSKILFIQFSNSGAYPPVQNAVSLCLREGHEVNVLCVASEGAESLRFPDKIEKITRRLPRSGGRIGRVFLYLRFMTLVLWKSFFNPDQCLYASDPMSAPAAYYAKKFFGCRVIYHEHDAPPSPSNRFQHFVNRARLKLAEISDAVVIPNADRLRLYLEEAGCLDRKNAFVVWNCPLAEEVLNRDDNSKAIEPTILKLYFHGSIVQSRLPLTLLDALKLTSDKITLSIVGYSSDGGAYVKRVLDKASELDISTRVNYLGSYSREALLPMCAEHDAGLCFYDAGTEEINHKFMAGASNKPFDYLSQGLFLIMSNTPEQHALFGTQECVRFCDPDSVQSMVSVLNELSFNKALIVKAKTQGPKLITEQWNYGLQFKPVLELFRL